MHVAPRVVASINHRLIENSKSISEEAIEHGLYVSSLDITRITQEILVEVLSIRAFISL